MFKYYWETIVHHHHDIMLPVLIVYGTIMYFLFKWFVRNELKKLRDEINYSVYRLNKDGKYVKKGN